ACPGRRGTRTPISTGWPLSGWTGIWPFAGCWTRWGADVRARIDGGMAAEVHAARLSRLGSRLLGDLVGHHQIEDDVYFPDLARLEPRIARGFDMLDADHHALHGLIDRFLTGANAVLAETGDAPQREAAGRFLADLDRFDRLLTRHLADEEDLV